MIDLMYNKIDALRIYGLHAWTATLERVADDNLAQFEVAREKAVIKCLATDEGTDPKAKIEAWAEHMAIQHCIRYRHGIEVTFAHFMVRLEYHVHWEVKRKDVLVDPSVYTAHE